MAIYRINDLIKIHDFFEPITTLYNPEDEVVGIIKSELSLNDVRLQIKKLNLEGYYIIFIDNDFIEHKVPISRKGEIQNWPIGFYDKNMNQLNELFEF